MFDRTVQTAEDGAGFGGEPGGDSQGADKF
jgi:hypothetical protein